MSKETYVGGDGLWRKLVPDYSNLHEPHNQDRNIRQYAVPHNTVVEPGHSGVFVELIDGKPVVSIRCSDSSKLVELTALARRIMDSIR
jgi:hypothetical protein